MTKTVKNLIIVAMLATIVLGWATWASTRTAAEFRVREEIAMVRISKADSTIAALRSEMSTLNDSVDSLTTLISLATVEVNQARIRARQADALAVAAEAPIEYDEPDSILVDIINANVEPNDFVVLCEDDYGYTKFCFNRSLTEEYLTKTTITLPALRYAVARYRIAVSKDSVLITNYADQVRLQTQQNTILTLTNQALTSKAEIYHSLYDMAKKAYKREKLFRQATLAAVGAGILVFLLAK